MARVQQRTARRIVQARRRATPADFGLGLSQGFTELGAALTQGSDLTMKLLDANQTASVHQAISMASTRIHEEERLAKNNPDFKSSERQFVAARDKILGEFRDTITFGKYRRQFDSGIFATSERAKVNVRNSAHVRMVDNTKTRLAEIELEQQQAYADAESPEEAEIARNIYIRSLDDAKGDGSIKDSDYFKAVHKFDQGNREAVLRSSIINSPAAALKLLSDPKNFPNMPPPERQLWIQKAVARYEQNVRTRIARENHAITMLNRQKKIREEGTAKEAIERMASTGPDGTIGLTVDWVAENEANFSKEDFKFYMDHATTGEGFRNTETDPAVYVELSDMARTGLSAEEFSGMARDALRNEDINVGSYNTLIKMHGSKRHGAARDFLKGALRVGEAVRDPAARIRSAAALEEFDSAVISTPDMSRTEAMEMATSIGKRAVPFDLGTTALILPKHAVIDTKAVKKRQLDIPASRKAIIKNFITKHNLGSLPRDEAVGKLRQLDPDYVKQMKLLNDWTVAQEADNGE